MKLLLLGAFCVLFPLTHIVMSHPSIRDVLISKIGRWPFRGLYSIVAVLTLGGAIKLFSDNRQIGPLLWELPHWLSLTIVLPLMFFAFQLVFLSLANPSPAGMMPAKKEVRGVLRITRHPMNMGFTCFALAHLVAYGYLGNIFFFGSFFLLGFIGTFHQDHRVAAERSEKYKNFRQHTSVLPFVAILRRKTSLELSELSFPMVILAVIAFTAMIFAHGRLFGISLF